MKSLIKYLSVLLMVVFLSTPTEATATSKEFLKDPKTPFRFHSEIDYICFRIPYSSYQLNHEWDAIMAMDIERIGRGSIPYYLHNREVLEVRYLEHEDGSIACFFYRSGLVFTY